MPERVVDNFETAEIEEQKRNFVLSDNPAFLARPIPVEGTEPSSMDRGPTRAAALGGRAASFRREIDPLLRLESFDVAGKVR